VNIETKEQSKQWMHTHSPNNPKKFKQTLSACQKADGNCFLGQERSAIGGIHATMDRNVSSVMQNTKKKTVPGHSEQRCGMLTSSVYLLHDNVHLPTTALTRTLLEHFNWKLFDHLFTALFSLRASATCLPIRRTGWDDSTSTIMRT
jgi:hypothetical protein